MPISRLWHRAFFSRLLPARGHLPTCLYLSVCAEATLLPGRCDDVFSVPAMGAARVLGEKGHAVADTGYTGGLVD